MIFICSFILLCVIVCVFLFLCAGGFIVTSGDKLLKTAQPVTQTEKKFFIDLNGKLIELMDKSEVRKARREGYTVVEK